MKIVLLVILLLYLGVAPCDVTAGFHDQQSLVLPRATITVPPPARITSQPAWTALVDRFQTQTPNLVLAGEVIALELGGRICALSSRDGRRKWCGGSGRNPVASGGTVAYVASDNAIVAVGLNGAVSWRVPINNATSPNVNLWSTGMSFIVSYDSNRSSSGVSSYREMSSSGHTLWSGTLLGASGPPFIASSYMFQRTAGAGATIAFSQVVARLGAHGGLRHTIEGAYQVLSVHGDTGLVAMTASNQAPEDNFLTSYVQQVSLTTGSAVADYVLAPDYARHLQGYRTGRFNGLTNRILATDQHMYVFLDRDLYLYYLDSRPQRPILLDSGVTYVGGPVRDTIFVAHDDGIWALTPRSNHLETRHVVSSSSVVTAFAAWWPNAFFAMRDGRIRGVNIGNGQTVLAADHCVTQEIEADEKHVVFTCGHPDRIVAFRSP